MHPFFEPLSNKESMLLLTALTVGGRDETQLFRFLPPDCAKRLEAKAQNLLEIPADKRIPFMIKEMKSALHSRGLMGIEMIDPSWLVHQLNGESPRVVATILLTLPRPTVRSLLRRLPEGIRNSLPPKSEIRQAPKPVIKALRQILDSNFVAMPTTPTKQFTFTQIIHLERKDLRKLIYNLGMSELGQAFVSVGRQALSELCRRLPRAQAAALIAETQKASSHVQEPELKSAQHFLSRVAVKFENTNEFFQKAGIWRMAKSTLTESAEFRSQLMQRLPREPGLLLQDFLNKASEIDDLAEEVVQRLQDSLLLKVQELSQRGDISSHWADVPFHFHNPSIAASAEAEPEPPFQKE